MTNARRDLYEKHIYDALHAASRDYDQAILTLSAGTLALSVTFAHDITPEPVEGTTRFLISAWACLVVSLVAIVLSFVTSQRILRDRLAHIDDEKASTARTKTEIATEVLNLAGGGFLIAGLVLLGIYAITNA